MSSTAPAARLSTGRIIRADRANRKMPGYWLYDAGHKDDFHRTGHSLVAANLQDAQLVDQTRGVRVRHPADDLAFQHDDEAARNAGAEAALADWNHSEAQQHIFDLRHVRRCVDYLPIIINVSIN